ncbi:hypothetical protein COU19_03260 [Candidatus Kaiserbacteria bacterium CG10_big_fil_rev_8_21_14_0_10_56_12]|uniref:HD domain-containing protein n=1 Tax=Candidatus Kaiserbacteria bacterium CG10_big_fil_rev_8_21_14_0_10_56_12 TaxID=1974611 RepID=A0A2H0U934_9BACT|nr:MAG: hypothetical protein COU19_03260 [Candidatus Kaiserbacteria bacterium CG10_big_fil_rev_8_21_14_0_10_56_12]
MIDKEAPLSDEQYAELRERILALIENECGKNPYHNRPHTEVVERRFLRLAEEARLSLGETQLGGVMALFHDFGHVGRTIRQETPNITEWKELSNEEYAAVKIDEILQHYLSHNNVVATQMGVLGTAFGQTTGKYERPYRPLSAVDALLAFADIAGFVEGFDAWIKESLNVYREMPLADLPETFDGYREATKGFVGYVRTKLSAIEPLIGEEAASRYRAQLEQVQTQLMSAETKARYESEYDALRREAEQKAGD